MARLEALPGVRSASLAHYVPFTNLYVPAFNSRIDIEGREPQPDSSPIIAFSTTVGLRYFQTMGIPLQRGRDFGSQEVEGAPKTAIVNETMARRFWPDEEVIGKRLRMTQGREQTLLEIVGVARDSKYFTLEEEPQPYFYLPLSQNYTPWATLQLRTNGNPSELIATVRRQVQALDANMPVYNVTTLSEALSLTLYPARIRAALLGIFGVLALFLASVGIYAVVSYSVSCRIHEIGIRMALGSHALDVLQLILKESLRQALAGIVLGLIASLALTRLVSSFLYQVSPTDPFTFAGISLLLVSIALVAKKL